MFMSLLAHKYSLILSVDPRFQRLIQDRVITPLVNSHARVNRVLVLL